jgi:hypothetical protein
MTSYTKSQTKALDYAFDKGGAIYAPHTLMGGAFRRCCERLVAQGLLNDEPPFGITMRGLVALRDIRAKKWADRGCIAYLDDLKKVEAALAQFPALAARAAA